MKFSVEEGEESEGGPKEEFLSMKDADGEDLFSKKLADVAGTGFGRRFAALKASLQRKQPEGCWKFWSTLCAER